MPQSTERTGSEQPTQASSPPSVSEDVRRLGLGRSSSPAKRSISQRDDADDDYDTEQRSPPRPDATPTKLSQAQHVSPMPSRVKSMIQRPEPYRAPSIDMLAEPVGAANGKSSSTTSEDTNGLPVASSPPTPTETLEAGQDRSALPSFDEQVRRVKSMLQSFNESTVEQTEGFLVATAWLSRVMARTTEGLSGRFEKSDREGEVGPIDNSNLVARLPYDVSDLRDPHNRHHFVPIKPGLSITRDFEIVSWDVWNLIVGWYGVADGSPTIVRYLHNTATDGLAENFIFELYPPIITVRKTVTRGTVADADNAGAPLRLVASRSDLFQGVLGRVKHSLKISKSTKIRVWKIIETLAAESTANSGLATPIASRDVSPERRLGQVTTLGVEEDVLDSMVDGQDKELVDVQDETNNPNYNGSLTLGTLGFMETQTLVIEEALKPGKGGAFASDKARAKKASNAALDLLSTKTASTSDDGRRSPTPGMMTRGRLGKRIRGKGSVGLQNLGNTCYMNSALQCIRSVEELTVYFLADAFKTDLNSNNPLGHNGTMAKAYAGLMVSFYETNTSFSPRPFRSAVGRCQPLFSGYGQQDSQEFLSFLIDALHEDLNRIQKKPYIENPDSDDALVHDPEYIRQLGETFRTNHAKRNDSVAMDLFTGFYKNTMVCPDCDKVSVTFDPYAQVTLQIPVENSLQHELMFSPKDGPPLAIDLDIDYNSSFKQVKEYVAERLPGLDPKCLVVAEAYHAKLYKIFDDREVLSEAKIASNDMIWVYELDAPPTNIIPKKQRSGYMVSHEDVPKMSSPLADYMAVPILHKKDNGVTMSPTFILLTREEAQDEELILRKILRNVQTMTTKDMLEDSLLNSSSSTAPSLDDKNQNDAVMTSEEDASSDDANIQARSIESEDDVVDVKMNGVGEAADTKDPALSSAYRASRFLDPDVFIDGALRSMFDVKFLRGAREIVPTNVPSSGSIPKDAESLQTRVARRQSQRRRSSASSKSVPSWHQSSLHDGDSSEDELAMGSAVHGAGIVATAQRAESSDEDDAIPPPIARRPPLINKARAASQDPYLVHLGECLVLDWDSGAYDSLFKGTKKNEMRGLYTNQHGLIAKIADPALEAKRDRLSRRKKQGVTLQECFTETARSEILSEDNAWYCNRCKEMRRATKTLELWTAPDVLIVHLKRFNMQSRWRDKIDAKVDFPIEGLDLTGKVGMPEDKSLIYDLFAVDKHFGGLGGGHYTAVAKNFMDGKWYDYNDSSVSPVSPAAAVDKSAYLLFYRRRAEGPLGPEYLQNLVGKATESTTRSSSESGEGQRLGGPSSPSGSSNGSHAAAAAHQLHALAPGESGGSARASQVRNANFATALDQHDGPPAYDDEGVSMDDADDPVPSAEDGGGVSIGSGPIYHKGASNWSFANLDRDATFDAVEDGFGGGFGRKAEPGTLTSLKLPPDAFGPGSGDYGHTNSDDETLGQDGNTSEDTRSIGGLPGSPIGERFAELDGSDEEDVDMAPSAEHSTTPDRGDDALVQHVEYKVGGAGTATDDEAVHDIRVSSGENSEIE